MRPVLRSALSSPLLNKKTVRSTQSAAAAAGEHWFPLSSATESGCPEGMGRLANTLH